MRDEGWTVTVTCPHGVVHRGPLSVLRGFEPLVDMCEDAKKDRMTADLLREPTWLEKRRFKKSLKSLRKSLESLRAPNASPPPSSPPTGPPSTE